MDTETTFIGKNFILDRRKANIKMCFFPQIQLEIMVARFLQ